MSKKIFIAGVFACVVVSYLFFNQNEKSDLENKEEVRSTRPRKSDRTPGGESMRRPRSQSERGNVPRLVDGQELSPEWRSRIEETLLPFAWAPPGMEPGVSRSSYKEAMGLIRYFIPYPLASTYPHSVYDGDHYLFFWGTHTNSPVRGLGVRKNDGKLMMWDVDGNHVWDEDADGKQVTRNRIRLKAYFFGKDEFEARQARMAAVQAKATKAYDEANKAQLRKLKAAKPDGYPKAGRRE